MYMRTCMYTRIYSQMHPCANMQTYTWIHMHIHTYINSLAPSFITHGLTQASNNYTIPRYSLSTKSAFSVTQQYLMHRSKPCTNPIFSHIRYLNTGSTLKASLTPRQSKNQIHSTQPSLKKE